MLLDALQVEDVTAQVSEAHEDLIQAVLAAFRSGMSWEDVDKVVEQVSKEFSLTVHDALYSEDANDATETVEG